MVDVWNCNTCVCCPLVGAQDPGGGEGWGCACVRVCVWEGGFDGSWRCRPVKSQHPQQYCTLKNNHKLCMQQVKT